ncbi:MULTISPECIES: DUF4097 family beta strand repeat-containing protein [unclassified Microbacterium]|uniref:DUF4097 family beta strand repeat-containing protein n=1 Tax=unclassified Microbacterium TaxID=2609290 RepID=UPI000B3537F6|nr:DUF4097 family beta strand repeat-containing protein [Microbacterium sp. JB110]RCS60229.1 hypothetical protein CIK77_12435 [Microbacterium sp. JB110]
MAVEKWLIHPGDTRVIDVEGVLSLKVGLVGGQVDLIAHDDPETRVEVRGVTVKDLRIEIAGGTLEIDHAQLGWDNFLEVFRNFGSGGPRAEVSIAAPRDVLVTLGVVSAGALVAGFHRDATVNTVSGDLLVDGHVGDLKANAVSGDVQVRGLAGSLSANTVSGDLTVAGDLVRADVDTVSSTTFIDASGPVESISHNGVSGAATFRLDDGYPANYALRSVSGNMTVDGVSRGGHGPSSYAGSAGALSGSFVDVKVRTVAGDITVLRRSGIAPEPTRSADAGASDGAATDADAASGTSDEKGAR